MATASVKWTRVVDGKACACLPLGPSSRPRARAAAPLVPPRLLPVQLAWSALHRTDRMAPGTSRAARTRPGRAWKLSGAVLAEGVAGTVCTRQTRSRPRWKRPGCRQALHCRAPAQLGRRSRSKPHPSPPRRPECQQGFPWGVASVAPSPGAARVTYTGHARWRRQVPWPP